MAIVLNSIEFEKIQSDLIVDQLPVSRILSVERGNRRLLVESLAPALEKRSLLIDGLQAQIIEQCVELNRFSRFRINVPVVASGGSAGWRLRQRLLHKLVAQCSETVRSV